MTLRIAILCLAAAAVWAQAPQPEGGALTGQVVSAADGSPLPGALVWMRTTAAEKTWTGPDGRFRFAGVPAGTLGLVVSKAGFHSDQRRQQGAGAQELVIRLVPESLIAGTAIGPDGTPLEGATVTLWEQPDRLGGVPLLFRRGDVVVDDLGRFRLHGLRAGDYLLTLQPAATPAPEGVVRLTAAPLLYPEPSGAADLATVRIRPGERVENIDFRAGERGQTALSGQVSDCGDCMAGVYRRSGEFFVPVLEMRTAGDGSFFLEGMAPGAYVIAARSRGPNGGGTAGLAEVSLAAGQTTSSQVYLTEGARMTIAKKHLRPPEQEQGTQRRSAGSPAVTFEYLGPQLAGGMQRGNGFGRGSGGNSENQVGLATGPYALRVRGLPPGGYLASVLVDGSPPLNGRFVIGDVGEHQTEVVVAYDSGTVEGSVATSEYLTLKDAEVYLLPQNPVLPNDFSLASVDETGKFSIQVGPGRYAVYSLPRDADWNLADDADRQRLAGYRASVEVRPGQTATVQVKLAPLRSW